MFTGIVQATGRVVHLARQRVDARLGVTSATLDLSRLACGDSLAVNGVCLTIAELRGDMLLMDVSAETLARTTFGSLKQDDEVNLETALTLQSGLGGHLVTGHVDGVGEVIRREQAGESRRLIVSAPPELARYIAVKGSICVDGVSLTVNTVGDAQFGVNLIPHTLAVTNLKRCAPGVRVNIEADLIARYLERLLTGDHEQAPAGGISREWLRRYGFIESALKPDAAE
jgi:riboflavin synthase